MNSREHPKHHKFQTLRRIKRRRTTLILIAFVGLFVVTVGHAQQAATPQTQTYTLPGDAVFPEGVAYDAATGNFYVGSTRDGAVYRGNVQDGSSELEVFLPGGGDGRTSVTGMKVDAYGRLFIAGRNTGRAFIYDTATGDLIKVLKTPPATRTLLNDVTVTADAAYFTDSFRPVVFRVSLTPEGVGEMERWLELRTTVIPHGNGFNLNGVAATPDGRYLLTVHFDTGNLYRIDTRTKEVVEIDLDTRLTTGDGLWLEKRTLYVVRENPASVVTVALSDDLASGEVMATLTHPSLDLPTTLAKVGDRLLVVNSQLDGTPPEPPFTVTSLRITKSR